MKKNILLPCNKTSFAIILFFTLAILCNLKAMSQTNNWYELRSFGINSFSETPIRSLVEDKSLHVIYAAVGQQVLRWNGGNSKWVQLGAGANALNADGIIRSITIDPSKKIYAAGEFRNAGNRCYVAQWNGTTWVELGGLNALNPSGPIYAVAADATGNIYAAGSFIGANGRYVAKWNGSTWTELGNGVAALQANDVIHTVCTDPSGNIYAAGNFTNALGKRYVAKWNGTSWQELGTGANALNANATILTIGADNAGNIFAAGSFTNGTSHPYVAKWNGTNWQELGTGVALLNANDRINKIDFDPSNNVFVAGDFTDAQGNTYVAVWNGTGWSTLGPASPAIATHSGSIYSIAIDTYGRYFCAGDFSNELDFRFVAFYNPAGLGEWEEAAPSSLGTIPGAGTGSISGMAAGKNDTLYATSACSVVRWDGFGWTDLGPLPSGSCSVSLLLGKNGTLYASSTTTSGNPGYLSRRNGQAWQEFGNFNGNIQKMAEDPSGNVYVVGTFTKGNGKYYVAKWNGSAWSEVGTGTNALDSDKPIEAICIDPFGNIYITAYKYFQDWIMKWDGNTWTMLSAEPWPAHSIISDSAGVIYVAGSNAVKKLVNGSWQPISQSYGGMTLQLDAINGLMMAAVFDDGKFVKKWTGSSWQKIGITPSNYTYFNCFVTDKMGTLYTDRMGVYPRQWVATHYSGQTYKFTGSGNWSDPSNWANGNMPPMPLTGFNKIVIDGPGSCILNVPVVIPVNSRIIVLSGANMVVQGNLTIE